MLSMLVQIRRLIIEFIYVYYKKILYHMQFL